MANKERNKGLFYNSSCYSCSVVNIPIFSIYIIFRNNNISEKFAELEVIFD
jgi:hypothetical protein